jgi:DNA polymerase-3 subunit delta'
LAHGIAGATHKRVKEATSDVRGWPDWADQGAVERLRESLRIGRVGHAYLLSGPKGVGKSDLARAFAQAICCTNVDASDHSRPCGECRACRNVAHGVHPDVQVVSLATQALLADKPSKNANLSIDTIRGLRSSAAMLPLESPRRVVIIDDAETMLEPAQQALLKTLEEPPPTVTLMLLADEQELLLETVRSRCQPVIVRPVAQSTIRDALVRRGHDVALASEIARLSRGSPAWAIAAASGGKLLQTRRGEWEAATTWLSAPRYDRLVTAFRLGEQYGKRRTEVLGVVQSAVQALRQEMLTRIYESHQESEEIALFPGAAFAPLTIGRAISASLQCLADLEANVRPRLALEAMVLAWPSLEHRPS